MSQDYIALKFEDLCSDCKQVKQETEPEESYTLCENCARGKKTIKTLTRKLEEKKKKPITGKTVTKLFYNNMNEVVMVPAEEFNRLSNYYQNKITESALLNKAG